MSNPTIFARRLKEAREAKGIKQRELAERIGVSYQTISAYEKSDTTGKIKNPTLENAVSIAKELGVSLDWLYGLEEQKSISEKYKTLGDIARTLVEISQQTYISVILEYSNNGLFEAPADGRAEIYFYDKNIDSFLREWRKIRDLLFENTIDERLYQLWLDDKFQTMDSMKIEN